MTGGFHLNAPGSHGLQILPGLRFHLSAVIDHGMQVLSGWRFHLSAPISNDLQILSRSLMFCCMDGMHFCAGLVYQGLQNLTYAGINQTAKAVESEGLLKEELFGTRGPAKR